MTGQERYRAALEADAEYSAVIARVFPGRTRWTLTPDEDRHPAVSAAYWAKVSADLDL